MKNQKKSVRKPVDVYKCCPSCKSKNLIPVAVDVLCGECDWMSCEEHVNGGGMDNLVSAFCEHFALPPEVLSVTSITETPEADIIHTEPSPQKILNEFEDPCEIEISA